jgi:hypothetical protein
LGEAEPFKRLDPLAAMGVAEPFAEAPCDAVPFAEVPFAEVPFAEVPFAEVPFKGASRAAGPRSSEAEVKARVGESMGAGVVGEDETGAGAAGSGVGGAAMAEIFPSNSSNRAIMGAKSGAGVG